MKFLYALFFLSFQQVVAAKKFTTFQPNEIVSKNGALKVTLTVDLVLSLDGSRLAAGYNGGPIGPTLRVKPGDTLTVTLINNLAPGSDLDRELYDYTHDPQAQKANDANMTIVYNRLDSIGNILNPPIAPTCPCYYHWGLHYQNIHFHGAGFNPFIELVSEALDGGGKSKKYTFKIPENKPPGFYWYHNHFHGAAVHSYLSGLYGIFIIDEKEPDPAHPTTVTSLYKDATEVFLLLAETKTDPVTKEAAAFFGIAFDFGWDHVTNGHFGNETVFNFNKGETALFRAVSAGVEPPMILSIDNHKLFAVAYDGYPAPSIEATDNVTISSGSRTEFLVKFDTPGNYTFRRAAVNFGISGVDACKQRYGVAVATCISYDKPTIVGTIIVSGSKVRQEMKPFPPKALIPVAPTLLGLQKRKSVGNREIVFQLKTGFPIFQIPYNGSFVPPGVGLGMNNRLATPFYNQGDLVAGTCETWNVISDPPIAGHPLHVHRTPFLITHLAGVKVKKPFWRDTMPIDGNVTLQICFDKTWSREPFLVHCHMVTHLDIGMSAMYTVVPPAKATPAPATWKQKGPTKPN